MSHTERHTYKEAMLIADKQLASSITIICNHFALLPQDELFNLVEYFTNFVKSEITGVLTSSMSAYLHTCVQPNL